ncbi:hypothetical protein, partial [Caballeronia sp. AZ7_KS35]|uniref:hypothetical protein n=1 Tax=Caballeronia sp. AZ7_KS35 TaxID=2921762 RepID=UPI002028896D
LNAGDPAGKRDWDPDRYHGTFASKADLITRLKRVLLRRRPTQTGRPTVLVDSHGGPAAVFTSTDPTVPGFDHIPADADLGRQ